VGQKLLRVKITRYSYLTGMTDFKRMWYFLTLPGFFVLMSFVQCISL